MAIRRTRTAGGRFRQYRPARPAVKAVISDRVAKSLGGEIVVDSEPGRGSTFTLWLPMKSNGGRPG